MYDKAPVRILSINNDDPNIRYDRTLQFGDCDRDGIIYGRPFLEVTFTANNIDLGPVRNVNNPPQGNQFVYFLYRDANLGAGPQLSTPRIGIDLLDTQPPILHWFNFCNGYNRIDVETAQGQQLVSLGPNSLVNLADPANVAASRIQQGELQFDMDPGNGAPIKRFSVTIDTGLNAGDRFFAGCIGNPAQNGPTDATGVIIRNREQTCNDAINNGFCMGAQITGDPYKAGQGTIQINKGDVTRINNNAYCDYSNPNRRGGTCIPCWDMEVSETTCDITTPEPVLPTDPKSTTLPGTTTTVPDPTTTGPETTLADPTTTNPETTLPGPTTTNPETTLPGPTTTNPETTLPEATLAPFQDAQKQCSLVCLNRLLTTTGPPDAIESRPWIVTFKGGDVTGTMTVTSVAGGTRWEIDLEQNPKSEIEGVLPTLSTGHRYGVFTQAVSGGPQDHTASDPIICSGGGQMIDSRGRDVNAIGCSQANPGACAEGDLSGIFGTINFSPAPLSRPENPKGIYRNTFTHRTLSLDAITPLAPTVGIPIASSVRIMAAGNSQVPAFCGSVLPEAQAITTFNGDEEEVGDDGSAYVAVGAVAGVLAACVILYYCYTKLWKGGGGKTKQWDSPNSTFQPPKGSGPDLEMDNRSTYNNRPPPTFSKPASSSVRQAPPALPGGPSGSRRPGPRPPPMGRPSPAPPARNVNNIRVADRRDPTMATRQAPAEAPTMPPGGAPSTRQAPSMREAPAAPPSIREAPSSRAAPAPLRDVPEFTPSTREPPAMRDAPSDPTREPSLQANNNIPAIPPTFDGRVSSRNPPAGAVPSPFVAARENNTGFRPPPGAVASPFAQARGGRGPPKGGVASPLANIANTSKSSSRQTSNASSTDSGSRSNASYQSNNSRAAPPPRPNSRGPSPAKPPPREAPPARFNSRDPTQPPPRGAPPSRGAPARAPPSRGAPPAREAPPTMPPAGNQGYKNVQDFVPSHDYAPDLDINSPQVLDDDYRQYDSAVDNLDFENGFYPTDSRNMQQFASTQSDSVSVQQYEYKPGMWG